MTLSDEVVDRLPTPCLVIDLEAVDDNFAVASAMLEGTSVRLRPHFKAHKCKPLLERQLGNRRWRGVTCQTSFEALSLAQSGFEDIFVSNQIVDRSSAHDLFAAARLARVTTVIDSLIHVDLLLSAERDHIDFDVLIEIDVGMGRCGPDHHSQQSALWTKADDASHDLALHPGSARRRQPTKGHCSTPKRSWIQTDPLPTKRAS